MSEPIKDVMVTHQLVTPDGVPILPDRKVRAGDVLTFGSFCGRARVLKNHGMGTVDVERLSDGACFRITGLSLALFG